MTGINFFLIFLIFFRIFLSCFLIFLCFCFRLVDIVERRNEIIECLEMDRVREAEEDSYINNHITLYTSKRDGDKLEPDKIPKEIEKEKTKKHKKEFKLKFKSKSKVDADKDIDESETHGTLEKKKKKKFSLF